MKKSLIVCLSVLLTSVFCSSCGHRHEPNYTSGVYWYMYFIVNELPDTVVLAQKHSFSKDTKITSIAPHDSILFFNVGSANGANMLEYLKRPTIEDGYKGIIQSFATTLTISDKVYTITKDQEQSFMICANYIGMQDPEKDFFYNYFFYIDESYLKSLQ